MKYHTARYYLKNLFEEIAKTGCTPQQNLLTIRDGINRNEDSCYIIYVETVINF